MGLCICHNVPFYWDFADFVGLICEVDLFFARPVFGAHGLSVLCTKIFGICTRRLKQRGKRLRAGTSLFSACAESFRFSTKSFGKCTTRIVARTRHDPSRTGGVSPRTEGSFFSTGGFCACADHLNGCKGNLLRAWESRKPVSPIDETAGWARIFRSAGLHPAVSRICNPQGFRGFSAPGG
jgi:hypothetical protein